MKKSASLLALLLIFTPFSNIGAQTVDILWQGDTYTAPFYPGKALWSKQSVIKLQAIPQGLGNPSSLNYRWIENSTVLGNISGVGKSNMSFKDSIFSKPVTFSVEIVGTDEAILAQSSLTLTPVVPMLAVYENNPLYGFMFHREVAGTHNIEGEEVTFSGFPLFFSTLSRTDGALKYKWSTNAGVSETKSSVTYRVPEEGSGTSLVSLLLSNSDTVPQTAKEDFLLQFGENNE